MNTIDLEAAAKAVLFVNDKEWLKLSKELRGRVMEETTRAITAFLASAKARGAMLDGFALVPVEPTVAMIKAANRALREIILSVPGPERKRRWGEPTERGYKISGDEKAAIRYRAMIAAFIDPPTDKQGESQ